METVDQATGEITTVATETMGSQDDFLTMGIVGTSVGLIEDEQAQRRSGLPPYFQYTKSGGIRQDYG